LIESWKILLNILEEVTQDERKGVKHMFRYIQLLDIDQLSRRNKDFGAEQGIDL